MKLITADDQELHYIKALVFGDSGIGKTTSLKTLPVEGTIIANAERSLAPLKGTKYKVVRFGSWDEMRDICACFLSPERIAETTEQAAVKACKFLVVDSLSEASDLCMRQIVDVDRRALLKERTKGGRETPVGVYEALMQLEDWNLYRTRMGNLISTLCRLPLNLICTCRAAWSKDKMGGNMQVAPNLSGKAALECPAQFDLVLHMEATKDGEGRDIRVWRTFNDGQTISKDASGKLDPFEATNWTALFNKILGKGDSK